MANLFSLILNLILNFKTRVTQADILLGIGQILAIPHSNNVKLEVDLPSDPWHLHIDNQYVCMQVKNTAMFATQIYSHYKPPLYVCRTLP